MAKTKMLTTVENVREAVAAAKKVAEAKFAADWRGPTVREAIETACANAHLFRQTGGL